MNEQTEHVMTLRSTGESGAEEWVCTHPGCGRRFLLTWPPDYKKVVIEPGDETAVHKGGKGGVQMGAPNIYEQGGDSDPKLAPFRDRYPGLF